MERPFTYKFVSDENLHLTKYEVMFKERIIFESISNPKYIDGLISWLNYAYMEGCVDGSEIAVQLYTEQLKEVLNDRRKNDQQEVC